MNAMTQMARLMTGEPVKLPARRQTKIERDIERAEAIQHGEQVRIAAYTKYLVQRGYVVMKARDFDAVTKPHQPMREGVV